MLKNKHSNSHRLRYHKSKRERHNPIKGGSVTIYGYNGKTVSKAWQRYLNKKIIEIELLNF